jgi:hypothetical protein
MQSEASRRAMQGILIIFGTANSDADPNVDHHAHLSGSASSKGSHFEVTTCEWTSGTVHVAYREASRAPTGLPYRRKARRGCAGDRCWACGQRTELWVSGSAVQWRVREALRRSDVPAGDEGDMLGTVLNVDSSGCLDWETSKMVALLLNLVRASRIGIMQTLTTRRQHCSFFALGIRHSRYV